MSRPAQQHCSVSRRMRAAINRRGFTLLEALMASGLLLTVVVAVTSAVTAGQQHAFEARQRIAATVAAEELMGRIIVQEYDQLAGWHGYNEPVGTMTDIDGQPMVAAMEMIGREVTVASTLLTLQQTGIRVRGRLVRVQAFNAQGRTLADLEHFVPEPPEYSS